MPPVPRKTVQLGVNIDHIAVLREARRINDPDPLAALAICAQNGADQITIHLREDRRHIQDADAHKIIASSAIPVNLECSLNADIIDIVRRLRPHRATLVPEHREEVTTEGGLDVVSLFESIESTVKTLSDEGVAVSLFIDPDPDAIEASKKSGAGMIELHTGTYANLFAMLNSALPHSHHAIDELKLPRKELFTMMERSVAHLENSAKTASDLGLGVAAGHGLNYHNVERIVAIEEIAELNIGQSIIARSVFTGLASAVSEMKALMHR